jgi:hypothetical protein
MKYILILFFSLITSSCNAGNKMDNLDSLFSKVLASSTADEEEGTIEEVWEYMSDNRIYVQVYSVDKLGNKTDIDNISNIKDITSVEVVFSKGEFKKSFIWQPIDNENIFILFREK